MPESQYESLVAEIAEARAWQRKHHKYQPFVQHALQRELSGAAYATRLEEGKFPKHDCKLIKRLVEHPAIAQEFVQGKLTFSKAWRTISPPARKSGKPAPPAAPRVFPQLFRTLQQQQLQLAPQTYDCGLFELAVTAVAPAPPQAEPLPAAPSSEAGLKVWIATPTAAMLDRLAARSGLNRAEAAQELLLRAEFGHWIDEFSHSFDPRYSIGLALVEHLHPRLRNAHRSNRLVALVFRPTAALRQHLTELGQGLGLSPNETATLLLESDFASRFAEIRAAQKKLEDALAQNPPRDDIKRGGAAT